MAAGRTTVSAVAAVLAAALLVVVLVTWAASIGPGGVLEGPGIQAERSSPAEPPPPDSEALPSRTRPDDPPPAANDGGPADVWIRAIAFVLLVATICLALFLLFLLARRLRGAYDARGRRAERPEEVAFAVIETPAAVAREILHDAEAQRLVLAAGPRATRSSSAGTGSRPRPRRPGSPGSPGRPRRSSRCASSSWWPPTTGRSSGSPACTARRGSPSTR